ncbi:hypothetical protein DFJ74DRAFT_718835 [Hyaloraphidium curvatum]|nr:hypothetical protein DFJ74DRAFT_718835 [Hyaloraphidium curvatum]
MARARSRSKPAPPSGLLHSAIAVALAPFRTVSALVGATGLAVPPPCAAFAHRHRGVVARLSSFAVVAGLIATLAYGPPRGFRTAGAADGGPTGGDFEPLLGPPPAPPAAPAGVPTADAPDRAPDRTALPPCGCSAAADDGEWVPRPAGAVAAHPLLRAFDNWNTSFWDSNCTSDMRALHTDWRPRTCSLPDPYFGSNSPLLAPSAAASALDMKALLELPYPPGRIPEGATDETVRMSAALAADPRLFALFGHKRIAAVGDSLVAQWLTGTSKFFPLSRTVWQPKDKTKTFHPGNRMVDPPPPFGFNITLDFIRENQPGEDFVRSMGEIFDSRSYDYVVVNFGIWYNQGAKPSPDAVKKIRAGNATGFTPLTAEHYAEDMSRFSRGLAALKHLRQSEGRWPRVAWAESTPQHFQNGSFAWSLLSEPGNAQVECHPYASWEDYLAKGHWRNAAAQPGIDAAGVPTMRYSRALHSLHLAHPYRYYPGKGAWGNDCTHYCEPSAKTVLLMRLFVGCLDEIGGTVG